MSQLSTGAGDSWQRKFELLQEESLNTQIEAETKIQAQQRELQQLQAHLTQLTQQLENWKQRALGAELRLLEYSPLDRQLLETQQLLLHSQQVQAQEQTLRKQAQERIVALERHVLQLKTALDLAPERPTPPAPKPPRSMVDLPPF